ncbi:hypothetical protein HYU11_03065 [Candidatus Woesearchaeota archaeon]|nr:hypothetical protein [Candidatus Woesearchaeota archaeon]
MFSSRIVKALQDFEYEAKAELRKSKLIQSGLPEIKKLSHKTIFHISDAFRSYIMTLLYGNQYNKPLKEIIRGFLFNLFDNHGFPSPLFIVNTPDERIHKEIKEFSKLLLEYSHLYSRQPEFLIMKAPFRTSEIDKEVEEAEQFHNDELLRRAESELEQEGGQK